MKKRRREIIVLAAAIAAFVAVSWLSQRYAASLTASPFLAGPWGRLAYVLAAVTGIVIAPIESFPLIPAAVTLWGPFAAAWLSILGWTIGSLTAFGIARRFGERLVYRFVSRTHVEELRSQLRGRHLFWLVVVVRLLLPVDLTSYAIGLFTVMPWYSYILATLIGTVPFAFLFAFAARYSVRVQLAIAAVIIVILAARRRQIKEYIKRLVEFVRCKTCD